MRDPQITPYRFGSHDLIVIGSVEYRPRVSDKRGHEFRRAYEPGIAEFFSHEEIYNLVRTGKLTLEKAHFLPSTVETRRMGREADLTTLTPEQRLQLLWKEDWCLHYLQKEIEDSLDRTEPEMRSAILQLVGIIQLRHDKRRKDLIAPPAKQRKNEDEPRAGRKRETFDPPSPETLKVWLDLYAKHEDRLIGLFDWRWRLSGNRTARADPESLELAKMAIRNFADDRQPSTANIVVDYKVLLDEKNAALAAQKKKPLPEVSTRTIQRMIKEHGSPSMLAARRGKSEAKRLLHPSRGGAPIYRPLQRVELDEADFNLMLLLKKAGVDALLTPPQIEAFQTARVWVTAAIDVCTKAILGIVIHTAKPSAVTALRCLEMAIMDKSAIATALRTRKPWPMHGLFLSCFTDGGSAFVSTEALFAIRALGSEWVSPPTGHPQFRGTIERVFGTAQRQFPRFFSGRTFADIKERGDYPSEAMASIDIDEFARALIPFIVDVYHTTPHSSLMKETPLDCWLRMTEQFPVPPPPTDPGVMRTAFGWPFERAIGNEGIRIFGTHYQSERLQKLRYRLDDGEKVKIRISHYDMSAISVLDRDAWITVPNALDDINLAGVGIDEWTAAWCELTRLNVDQSEHHAAAAFDTLRDLRTMGDHAIRRAGLSSPIMSIKAMDKFEAEFFGQLQYRRDRGPGPKQIDFGTASSQEPPAASPAQPPKSRWTIEDL